MNKARKYSLPEVFNNTSMGFVFEFYSSKETNFIVEELSKLTIKNVILTNTPTYNPTFANAILIKEYDGSKPRYSFSLAQQKFSSVIPLMKSILEWISETSECRTDTLMRVNMSFDHDHLKTLYDISKMNTQKLVLKIDEEYIYSRFPLQEDSAYSMSIKNLMPISEAIYVNDLIKNVNYVVGTPMQNYFGINFENYTKGTVQFNYIGGEDYSEKPKEILEILEYYVIKTYQSLNEAEYTKDEVIELKEMTNEFYKLQEAYYEPEKFTELFPEIQVAVDMRRDSQMLKSFWPKIKNTLFDTVINNNLREGQFNFDTQYGIFQLRNATLNCTKLKDFDLVKCDVQGVLENCNLITCEVTNARIYRSNIVRQSSVSDSYLHKVTVEKENKLDNCFVENNYEMLNCNITNSVLKFPGLGKSARLDESTVVIDKQEALPKAVGVEVEEIRDYKWTRDLLGKKEEGHKFGNEYIKKTYI